ncbi:GGDEF domain-containing protein [Photobacterium phosphoreum]|uniref:GGDEF domain-containing protein n=1 Tax=Photobacterium phosphoreum TaxID=659 RepID=UPI0039AF667D
MFLRENINDNKKDKLTGLYRKDFFNDTKYSVSCIIIIDIDYFKNINDTYGHQVGDIVLKEVSDRIRYFISKTDIGIRWGGEEFVILLGEEIDIKQLKIKLNQLLHAISDIKICNIDVTISIGSFLSPNKIILANAFKSADEALYESKRTGRNKYTILMN